jgi:alanine dehydrogenase
VVALAGGTAPAIARHPELLPGFNVIGGKTVNRAVAESLDVAFTDPAPLLGLGG